MPNPIQSALNSKLGMKLRGVSIVDNSKNPDSAYSKAMAPKKLKPVPNAPGPINKAGMNMSGMESIGN